jgi:hypothetical protein
MGTAVYYLGSLCGLAAFVCYVLVLVQMFQHGKTGLGIACIVLLFCCGIGYLIAFVYGWMNAKQWNIQNIMMAWTALFAGSIVLQLLAMAMGGVPQFMNVPNMPARR